MSIVSAERCELGPRNADPNAAAETKTLASIAGDARTGEVNESRRNVSFLSLACHYSLIKIQSNISLRFIGLLKC